ncbi:MAG: hypothetical protein HQK51_08040, partial [Oligoflexia bacterium]|nr:hypothetical protein [Oligoflexia bacterium]
DYLQAFYFPKQGKESDYSVAMNAHIEYNKPYLLDCSMWTNVTNGRFNIKTNDACNASTNSLSTIPLNSDKHLLSIIQLNSTSTCPIQIRISIEAASQGNNSVWYWQGCEITPAF